MTNKIRLDLYLFRARLFKSRSKATEACREGRILVEDRPARASTEVWEGVLLRIREKGLYRDIRILELPGKSLSKEAARLTWRDETPQEVEIQRQLVDQAMRIRGTERNGARPTKKERRTMDRLKNRR